MAVVLLVEPDRQLRDTYRQAIASTGHTVHAYATAQQAISGADDQRPDVVVLEPQLVAHSGIEFLYEFRSYEDWRSVPVILYTTIPEAAFRSARNMLYDRLGVRAHYYKPHTNLRTLCAAVQAAATP